MITLVRIDGEWIMFEDRKEICRGELAQVINFGCDLGLIELEKGDICNTKA